MAQINPKITIRSVYLGMLLLSAAVMILAVRLTIASELVDSLKTVAEHGDATAQFSLGYKYATGEGVPQNYTEAVRWFRMAAEQGDAKAQVNLGYSMPPAKVFPRITYRPMPGLTLPRHRAKKRQRRTWKSSQKKCRLLA